MRCSIVETIVSVTRSPLSAAAMAEGASTQLAARPVRAAPVMVRKPLRSIRPLPTRSDNASTVPASVHGAVSPVTSQTGSQRGHPSARACSYGTPSRSARTRWASASGS